MKIKKILLISGILIFIAGVVLVGAEGRYRYGRAVVRDTEIYIPTGSSGLEAAMDSLSSSGAVENLGFLRKYVRVKGIPDNVRPGRYELKEGMSFAGIINMLLSGRQSPVRVTFNNNRDMEALAGSLSRTLEVDSVTMLRALRNDSIIYSYGFEPETFIAMFVPNTYEFYWNTGAEGVIDRMNKEYEKFWKNRDVKLARTGLSREQAVTLASIVYEETKKTDEMSRVAGVYMNRLKVGMPLQADPTIKFALGDFAMKRIWERDIEKAGDSPYNTYRFKGLPPGPISMPSIAAVDGVLDYEGHDYYYFCASPDLSGYHVFATNLAAHSRNAQAYHSAVNKLGIR